ncbi:hypothetical protein DL93DRAFT_1817896 [Clavulina sp. PMI_390]|nr:hypothetical protein DL93DRAFT_1817896 [Clavulina sp. PMI_390]
MPLKPCLKSSRKSPREDDPSIVATSHPPIPESTAQLPRTSSYIDYSPLPYSHVYVHFPPSPILTSTHVVDPPRLYDRSPIVVAPNTCAMPQRGCPGRTYATIDGVGRGVRSTANALALSSSSLSLSHPSGPQFPLLIHDEHGSGSSSDDSDAVASFADETLLQCNPLCLPGHHVSGCCAVSANRPSEPDNTQFLPYPPMPPRVSKFPSKKRSSMTPPSASTPPAAVAWDTSSCLEGF